MKAIYLRNTENNLTKGFQHKELFLLWSVLLFASLLRFCNLGAQPLWLDEILQLLRSSKSSIKEILISVKNEIAAAPLNYLIQHFVIKLGGNSEFVVRLHAAIFGTLSILILYVIAKLLYGYRVALLASFLYSVYPLHLYHSREGRVYALLVFLTLCSYYLFLKTILTEKRGYWIAFTLINILYLYSHFFASLIIISQGCFLLLLNLKRIHKALDNEHPNIQVSHLMPPFLVSVAICSISFLPWAITALPNTKGDIRNTFDSGKIFFRLIKEISGGYPLFLVLFPIFITGSVSLIRQNKLWQLYLLLTWLFLPIPIIIFLDWYRNYHVAVRQFLFLTPAFFMVAAYGIPHLNEMLLKKHAHNGLKIIACTLMVILSLGSSYLHSKHPRYQWKEVARFLESEVKSGDLIAAPNIEPVISYYFPEIARFKIDLDQVSNFERNSQSSEKGKIYLVKSKYITESQNQSIQHLLKNYTLISQREFIGFTAFISSYPQQSTGRQVYVDH